MDTLPFQQERTALYPLPSQPAARQLQVMGRGGSPPDLGAGTPWLLRFLIPDCMGGGKSLLFFIQVSTELGEVRLKIKH